MERELLKIFRNLEGEWLLSRKIYDSVSDKTEYAEGIAVFRPATDLHLEGYILDYEETGKLKLTTAQKQLNFKRNYIYKYLNETIEIYLNDGVTKGKLFQKLLRKGDGEQCSFVGTEHICRADKHNGGYYFKNAREFETYFTIEGEHKEIVIETSYKKTDHIADVNNMV